MKSQTYTYEDKGVSLTFQFKEDEDILNNKIIFSNLLRQALSDLDEEIQAKG